MMQTWRPGYLVGRKKKGNIMCRRKQYDVYELFLIHHTTPGKDPMGSGRHHITIAAFTGKGWPTCFFRTHGKASKGGGMPFSHKKGKTPPQLAGGLPFVRGRMPRGRIEFGCEKERF